jgi:hypothetical protein
MFNATPDRLVSSVKPVPAYKQTSICDTAFATGSCVCRFKRNAVTSQTRSTGISSPVNTQSSRLLLKNLKMIIYKTIILPAILHGCETWSLTLREEHRLRVFENKHILAKEG